MLAAWHSCAPTTPFRWGLLEENLSLHQTGDVLECFQVAQPVVVSVRPHEEPCSALLMSHVFAWSYGEPFVGMFYRMDVTEKVSQHGDSLTN